MCFSTQPVVDPDTDFGSLSPHDLKRLNPHYKIGVLNPAYRAWLQKQRDGGGNLNERVFPLGPMPFIRILDGTPDPQIGLYGLLPALEFVTDKNYARKWSTYNARSDKIFERQTNREAVKFKRCVLPTQSFWEWSDAEHEPDKKAHMYHISMEDGRPFLIGGLWEWHPQFGFSCSIVTTDAIKQVWEEAHHNRSPLILAPEQVDSWLDPTRVRLEDIEPLLRVWSGGRLKIERVK